MPEHSYLKAASLRASQLTEEALRLVACESPSEDHDSLERSAKVVSDIGERILGTAPQIIREGTVPHVLWRFGTGRRRVLLLGHHDTVWPIGTLDRIPAQVVGGVMSGPGCFDMKVGVVQAFVACALIIDHNGIEALDGVTILVTGDEEIGSPTSRALIERESVGCDAALVLEAAGPGGALKVARKGVSRYELEVTGRAAHAGLEPEMGINAGVELAAQIPRIAGLGSFDGGTTVVPTNGTIGTTSNTVPAVGRVAVDVRARTSSEQMRVDAEIRLLTPSLPGTSLRVSGGVNRPPMETMMSAELFGAAVRAAWKLGIAVPEGIAVGGASDGNFTVAMGVPTLDGLGAVGGGAHSEYEHVEVALIPDRTALLAELMDGLLSDIR